MSVTGKFMLLLLPAIALVAASMVTSHYFLPPMPGGSSLETLLPEHACLAWNFQRTNPPDQVARLDLNTGQVTKVKRPQIAVLISNSRGQKISTWSGIELFDAHTGERLWRDESLTEFEHLVGDRYLVRQIGSRLTILDMQPVFEHPTADARPGHQPMELDVPGLVKRVSWSDPQVIQPIEGCNRFLCVARGEPTSVSVYEIDAGQVRQLESWRDGGGQVIQHEGQIWSSTPGKHEVEVRSTDDFRIIKRLRLPFELSAWNNVTHRQDLFSFTSTKTGKEVVCRLTDMQPNPKLNLPLLKEVITQKLGDRRYHILSDGLKSQSFRIVVFDSQSTQVVYDAAPPLGLVEIGINDGHLFTVTEAMGLTVESIDLSTGKVVRQYRPYMGSLAWITALALCGLFWSVVWSYCSVKWEIPSLLNVSLVISLVSSVFIWRVQTVGYWNTLHRPAADRLKIILFVLCFMISLYAAFGKQRVLLRLSAVWLWLAALVACTRLCGLELQPYVNLYSVDGILRTAIVFTGASTLLLLLIRWTTLPKYFMSFAPDATASSFAMRDLFAFIASVALFLTAAQPYRQVDWTSQLEAISLSALILLPAVLGLVGLVRNRHVFRVAAAINIALGFVAILATMFHIAAANYYDSLAYRFAGYAISLLFVMLTTFAICSLLRGSRKS